MNAGRTREILMNQNDQAQDIFKTEKPAIPAAGHPADKDDMGGEQRPEGQPRDRADEEPPQPIAHPPEDTIVAPGTHPQPGKSAR